MKRKWTEYKLRRVNGGDGKIVEERIMCGIKRSERGREEERRLEWTMKRQIGEGKHSKREGCEGCCGKGHLLLSGVRVNVIPYKDKCSPSLPAHLNTHPTHSHPG